MLSPSDIRPAVEEVLRSTGNSLASYQILDRLPEALRDQIIAERGMPGAGQGNRYTAASLVTDAVELLLPSKEAPYRVYLEMGDTTFTIAGQIIKPGNAMIAYYKLSPPATAMPPIIVPTTHDVRLTNVATPTQFSPSPVSFGQPTKTPWYDRGGLLVLWLFLFWPVAVYGFIRSTKIPKAAKYATLGVFLIGGMMNAAQPHQSTKTQNEALSTFSEPEHAERNNTLRTSAPKEKPMTWHMVKRFEGSGIKSTETFEITSDEWRISWNTKAGQYGGMNFQIFVFNADGSLKDLSANVIGTNADSSIIRGEGRYYLKFNTAQPYSVQVEERR